MWPLLGVHPGNFTAGDGAIDLAAAIEATGQRAEFRDRGAQAWLDLRRAYFTALREHGVRVIAPNRSVVTLQQRLDDAWRDNKLHLPLLSFLNGERFGKPNAGIDMTFDFGQLIAHAAKSRPLTAGSIIGSGTVSNKLDGGPGKPIAEGGVGYSCIAELRTIEAIDLGASKTSFLNFGDRVRIEMLDANGASIFGAIDQVVEHHEV